MWRGPLDGFDKHYRLFREAGQQAKEARFEAGDWQGLQQIQRDRIDFYNERVRETSLIGGMSTTPSASRTVSGSRSSCTTSGC